MNFKKYWFGSRELVIFIDESGDPKMQDPTNPLFVLGGCAVLGEDVGTVIRQPWLAVRKALTGSEATPVHMRETHRIGDRSMAHALEFFNTSDVLRISIAITDRTVFETTPLPKPSVLAAAFALILKLSEELLSGIQPIEAVSVIFEDGPLIERLEPFWRNQVVNRSDGVRLPVSWAALSKDHSEPGLEIADFISHSAAGFIRSGRDPGSKFSKRYFAVHPIDRPEISRGWELNKVEPALKNEDGL